MKYLLSLFLFILSACGFTPVYGSKSPETLLTSIAVEIIPNREGQIVRNHLIDRLYNDGYPKNPTHKLYVSMIEENIAEIGIDIDDEASRAQLRQKTNFRLIDIKSNDQ